MATTLPNNPDELDALLRRAMAARAEVAAPSNLAMQAMAMARTMEAEPPSLAIIARVNRLNRIVTALAAVVIVAVSAWIFHARLSAGGFQPWPDTSTTSSTSDDNSTATTTTTSSESASQQWMFVGIALAVASIGILAAQRTISSSDDWMLRWNALARS
jgi:hypothetical protein